MNKNATTWRIDSSVDPPGEFPYSPAWKKGFLVAAIPAEISGPGRYFPVRQLAVPKPIPMTKQINRKELCSRN
jgi:hypothetical protein